MTQKSCLMHDWQKFLGGHHHLLVEEGITGFTAKGVTVTYARQTVKSNKCIK